MLLGPQRVQGIFNEETTMNNYRQTLAGDLRACNMAPTVHYRKRDYATPSWLRRQSLKRSRSHRLGLVAVLLPIALVAALAYVVYK